MDSNNFFDVFGIVVLETEGSVGQEWGLEISAIPENVNIEVYMCLLGETC